MSAQVPVSCSACQNEARKPLASTVIQGSAPLSTTGRSPYMPRRQVRPVSSLKEQKPAQTLPMYTRVIVLQPGQRCLQVLSAGAFALCCWGWPSSVYASLDSPSQGDYIVSMVSTSDVPASRHLDNQYDSYAGKSSRFHCASNDRLLLLGYVEH